jgi:hypothetical protein
MEGRGIGNLCHYGKNHRKKGKQGTSICREKDHNIATGHGLGHSINKLE